MQLLPGEGRRFPEDIVGDALPAIFRQRYFDLIPLGPFGEIEHQRKSGVYIVHLLVDIIVSTVDVNRDAPDDLLIFFDIPLPEAGVKREIPLGEAFGEDLDLLLHFMGAGDIMLQIRGPSPDQPQKLHIRIGLVDYGN